LIKQRKGRRKGGEKTKTRVGALEKKKRGRKKGVVGVATLRRSRRGFFSSTKKRKKKAGKEGSRMEDCQNSDLNFSIPPQKGKERKEGKGGALSEPPGPRLGRKKGRERKPHAPDGRALPRYWKKREKERKRKEGGGMGKDTGHSD